MKLVKFIYNEAQTPVENAIDTVTMHVLAYGKLYDLLHKQIWRKDRGRIHIATLDTIPTFNDRPVGFVRLWDIKSPSTLPYSYEGDSSTFGLNQLLMGQDYRKTYNGDPGDGIYHDDCYIMPKTIETTATYGHKHAWVYYQNGYDIYGEDPTYVIKNYDTSKKYFREDIDGSILISSVGMNYYTVASTSYRKIVITYADNSTQEVELGSYDPNTFLGDGIDYGECNNPQTAFGYANWYNPKESFSEHGDVVAQYSMQSNLFSDTTFIVESDGWIRVYQDGTVVQFSPEVYYDTSYYPPSYSILPMIYLDTGDLTMDKVEFVEKWDTYFELFVHEDKEWYSSLVAPFLAIVTVVVAYNTGILFNPFGAIGTGLSAFGTLSGNRNLSLVGGILMAGAGIYNAIEDIGSQAIENQAIADGFRESYAQALAQNASFSELFDGFISNAGFSNWLSIGSKAFTVGGDLTSFGSSTTSTTTSSEETTSKSVVYVQNNSALFDVQSIINDPINIL